MTWLINLLLHRGNDLSTYFLPNAYFFKRYILEHGTIPAWNPIQFAGMPYLADPQNYIFYFPNYLLVILPIEAAFLLLIFAHIIWAGLGMYRLAQTHFGLNAFFSLASSLFFIFTPKIFAHLEAGHYTMLLAFSWLPWFMLVAFKFLVQATTKRAMILAVISWFMYLNYINVIYFALMFFYIFAFFKLFTQKLHFRSFVISQAVFIILFLVLISPSLIPQLRFAPHSTRQLITYQDVAQPIWGFKLFAQNLLFPFKLTFQQLSTERVLFPGITIWFLAAIGWHQYKSKDKYFYLGWLVFSLLFALGDRIPFFIVFYKFFPLMSWMRITTRPWIITLLCLAIFAALGLKRIPRRHFLIVACFLELLYMNFKIFSKPIPSDPTPPSFYQLISQDINKPFRAYCTTGCFSLQKLGELGIWSLAGNNPIQSATFAADLAAAAGYSYSQYSPVLPPYPVFDLKPQPSAQRMIALNTKYVASPYILTDPGFHLRAQSGGYFLYEVE